MIEKVYINVRGFNHVQNKRCTWGGRVVRHRSDPVFIGPQPAVCGHQRAGGVVHPGASLAKPIGVSEVGLGLLQIVIAVGAALVPLLWMLRGTRLQTDDLRITVPAPWSPAFCLPVFLGVASTVNLCGGLLVRLAGAEDAATLLPSGGAELFVQFLALCAVPAVVEELLFRGALQG